MRQSVPAGPAGTAARTVGAVGGRSGAPGPRGTRERSAAVDRHRRSRGSPALGPSTVTDRLVVGSWNVRHGFDARRGRIDLGAVAARLEGLGADVVALQEVDRGLARSGHADQLAELATRLDWHALFAPALLGDPAERPPPAPCDGSDPGGPAYGIGILSRFAPAGYDRRPLPGAADPRPGRRGRGREHRVLLRTRLTAGGTEVTVAATHLSWLPGHGARQLRTCLALAGAGPGPAVLLGDLNLPLRAVARLVTGTGWRPAPAGPSFPARRPRVQLDHVLVRGPAPTDGRVAPPGPSDHLPVRATLSWPWP